MMGAPTNFQIRTGDLLTGWAVFRILKNVTTNKQKIVCFTILDCRSKPHLTDFLFGCDKLSKA